MGRIHLAIISLSTCALIFLISGCNTTSEVSGEVFIRTQGGMNFKLGDVTVTAHSADEMRAAAESNSAIIEDQLKEFEGFMDRCKVGDLKADCSKAPTEYNLNLISLLLGLGVEERFSDSYTFDSPRVSAYAVATATTNSDGKYSLVLPKGEYYIVAMTSRQTFDDLEQYQWLVPVESKGEKVTVQLTGSNLFSPYQVKFMDLFR